MHHYIIYMYTFPNGKRYIGKTKRTLALRQQRDMSGYKRCGLLWKAIQKYGMENIRTDILFEADTTDKQASKIEQFYIELFRTNANKYRDPAYGYNLTAGGEGLIDWKPSPERLKALQEQAHNLGKSRKGTHPSEETRLKQRIAKLGHKRGTMSNEVKAKISRANSRENMSEETRQRKIASKIQAVKATHKLTGEILIFKSQQEAAEHFGVRDSAVSRWISGNRRPRAPYIFENYSPTTTE